ncbi:TetR/AcrR family transcriptional regulator [Kribbella deserti]|uniref:TetR/AcrR family transcriptional regulator n=1 Tax=Kribbella deserti TaxID=1926257 RepID=A0ABV6QTP2_9ACTN
MSTELAGPTRRDRQRAATVAEIKAVARQRLVEGGQTAIGLRAIARDLGLSAPALYRYFPSHEDLITALITDLFDELTEAMVAARDEYAPDDIGGRLYAIALGLRAWAVDHPAEFGLVFGSPVHSPMLDLYDDSPCHQAGMRFGAVFKDLMQELWRLRPFEIPPDDELGPELVAQLQSRAAQFGGLPPGAIYLSLTYWTRVYGLICMEIFGQLHWALDDAGPYFQAQLNEIARALGLDCL